MAALCARMTTNIAAATPASAVMACQLKAGSPRLGSPPGTGPTTAAPCPARSAARLAGDVAALAAHGGQLRWLVIDWTAIGDVDYTASTVLVKVVEHLHQRQVRLVFSSVLGPVKDQLDRYGIRPDACYDTPGEALEAFRALEPPAQ